MYVCMCVCVRARAHARACVCISANFVTCLEFVNQHIVKKELNVIINVYSSVFITDNRGNVELILVRDYRIHLGDVPD
jgi:hypothetical protein